MINVKSEKQNQSRRVCTEHTWNSKWMMRPITIQKMNMIHPGFVSPLKATPAISLSTPEPNPIPCRDYKLVAKARTLYAALDLKLGGTGGGGYFFGSTATSLDACVFGHLAEAWTIGALLDILPAYENLSR